MAGRGWRIYRLPDVPGLPVIKLDIELGIVIAAGGFEFKFIRFIFFDGLGFMPVMRSVVCTRRRTSRVGVIFKIKFQPVFKLRIELR